MGELGLQGGIQSDKGSDVMGQGGMTQNGRSVQTGGNRVAGEHLTRPCWLKEGEPETVAGRSKKAEV